MGGTLYSNDDYITRSSVRATTAKDRGIDIKSATFAHTYAIHTGTAAAKVHDTLRPYQVTRESRDSDVHPVSVPIGVIMDTTGSMATVPAMLQEKLSKLMGCFLDDKASGKKYLGEGYPAILMGAVDDFSAMVSSDAEGTLQVGQFESGIEIDDNLTNIWLTGHGGGSYEESYDLALYFFARHTKHDHWDKRGRKGYLFIIGDEHCYPKVRKLEVEKIIGDKIQDDILVEDMIREAQERYHVFFILPNMTQHYHDASLEKYWQKLLGQQNVLKLQDPDKICEMIVSAVALCEENIGIDDLAVDFGIDTKALVPLSKSGSGAVAKHSAEGLAAIGTDAGGTTRL